MATYIFPTTGDIGGSGKGKTLSEVNLAGCLNSLNGFDNDIKSGLNPSSSASLVLTIPAGEAFIAGYRVTIDTASTVTCTASTTGWVFLTLTRDASQNVTGATFSYTTVTSVPTADQVKIAKITASGTAATVAELYPTQWINVGEAGAPAFANSWVNFDTTNASARYCRRRGIVFVEGLVKNGTAVGTVVFTLPAGYRPQKNLVFASASNNAFGRLDIVSDGTVVAVNGTTIWFSVNATFPADV